MYGLLRPLLFRLEPETAHHLVVRMLASPAHALLPRAPTPSPRLAVAALGAQAPAPVGVAAGFDKEATCHNALLRLGFGHAEVGTVTLRPQPGNPRPRMHRLPAHQALVNSLGFPNPGAPQAARRLAAAPPVGLVGVNVGPNKDTPADRVAAEVADCARQVACHARYVAVNVSSPNTPGLRQFQTSEGAATLVQAVREALDEANTPRPVLLKLHPDAPDADLARVARAAVDAGAAGLIAVNTTRQHPAFVPAGLRGGLSGPPLRPRALAAVAALHRAIGDQVPIVGVGGVSTGQDALALVRAGATLVQAYTGFVYRGPRFPTLVHADLLAELDRAGLDRIGEAVGADA